MNEYAINRFSFKHLGDQTCVVGSMERSELDQLDAVMLHEHLPPILLPVTVQQADHRIELVYEIGSRKPLHEWLCIHEVSEQEVLQTLLHICNSLLAMRNYLLDEHRCTLHPKWMFVGESILELKLLYWPFVHMQGDERQLVVQLHDLTLKLAPHYADMSSLRELLSSFEDPIFTLHRLRRRVLHLLDHMEVVKEDVVASQQQSEAGRFLIQVYRGLRTKAPFYTRWKKKRNESWHAPATHTIPLRTEKRLKHEASLIFLPNGVSSMKIPITRSPFRIGRDVRLADWSWDDTRLSRTHVELKRRGDRYTVRDIGSRNGTILNGEKLTPYTESPLVHGDRLELANLRFQFCWEQTDRMV